MKEMLQKYRGKMEKSIEVMQGEFAAIRAGRANPQVLDKIDVDYYGVPTKINQMAAVSVPDARTLLVVPWDISVLKEVEKAILTSDIGLTPQNDGKQIRMNFPPLTEERRLEIVKTVSKLGEDCKVAIRSIRRDALDKFRAQQKNAEITEDDLKNAEKEVQKLTDEFCAKADSEAKAKEQEILEI